VSPKQIIGGHVPCPPVSAPMVHASVDVVRPPATASDCTTCSHFSSTCVLACLSYMYATPSQPRRQQQADETESEREILLETIKILHIRH